MTTLSRATPTRLKTEHLQNPLGIAARAPRLSWRLTPGDAEERGLRQSAYQIVVRRTPDDGAVLWDSGRVESDQCVLVPYAGEPLKSGERAWWRVRVWDQEWNASPWSETAFWEMGLLRQSDWQAKWLSLRRPRTPLQDNKTLPPCSYFRLPFVLDAPLRRARLYATARGAYRFHLNGSRVGDAELAPGWTDYHHRIQYQTYDVTDLLQSGENVIGAILGDGWFSGYVGCRFRRENYGERPELLAQLHIELEDGSVQIVKTEGSWRATEGPLVYSDLLVGECYDARLELTGWDSPGYDASVWRGVAVEFTPAHAVPLVPQPDLPVRVVQELSPRTILHRDDGAFVVDMGQNMAGRVRLTIRGGKRGDTIRLRFAEVLQPDNTLYTANLRRATSTDAYILRGSEDGAPEVYEPYFTFHGFRYVEVTGYPGDLAAGDIVGRVMESETELTGTMETGHPMVNQLLSNIAWGQRGNFLSVPTDCPQRDERMGWTGDAQIFVRTAAYNRDVAAFFTKWMADVLDAQSPQGSFPNIAPAIALDGDGAPAWGDAGVIIPWTIFQMYGDKGILERCYSAMARWITFIDEGNPDGIWRERSSYNFSDWLSIEADTPPHVLGTAYFAYDCDLMARIAAVLGKDSDAAHYQSLFAHVRDAFCREFVDAEGFIEGRTQTVYALALTMNLLPENLRPLVAKHLVDDIERRGGHLSTGFVGVSYLCPVLTQAGYTEVAYRLLLNDTFPSWGYSIKYGATTIWERWDGWTDHKGFQDPGMNSFNHYSLGSVGEWLYRFVAGIDAQGAAEAGFQHFTLRPYPNPRLGFARANYQSPYGEIVSDWRIDGDTLDWRVVIPPNTTATIFVPSANSDVQEKDNPAKQSPGLRYLRREEDREVYAADSGSYTFRSQIAL